MLPVGPRSNVDTPRGVETTGMSIEPPTPASSGMPVSDAAHSALSQRRSWQ
jgi:hypothetical protein